MSSCFHTHLKRTLICLSALLMPDLAVALGLDKAEGLLILGKPLRLEIRLINPENKPLALSCFTVHPSLQQGGVGAVPKDIRLELARRADQSLLILTAGTILDPIIGFSIQAGCGFGIAREYVLLPDINKEATVPVLQGTVQAIDVPLATPRPEWASKKPLLNQSGGGESVQLLFETSLEKLAQERYPLQPKARKKFMLMMLIANPEMADTSEKIPAGRLVQIPKGLPLSRSASPNAEEVVKPVAPVPSVANPPQTQAAFTAKRRTSRDSLVIETAADSPEKKLLTELANLIPLIKGQNLIQTAVTQKIASMEEEFGRLKLQNAELENRLIVLDKALQAQKITSQPTQFDVTEMILAVLLAGLSSGLGLLGWQRLRPGQPGYPRYPSFQSENMPDVASPVTTIRLVPDHPINPTNAQLSTSPVASPDVASAGVSAAEHQENSIQGAYGEVGGLTSEDYLDPVVEAEAMIAYGREDQAEEVLLHGIQMHPERETIYLKLLEVYAKRNNAVQFEVVANSLRALVGGQGYVWREAEQLARTLGNAGGVAVVGSVLSNTSPQSIETVPAAASVPVGTHFQAVPPISPEDASSLDYELELGEQSSAGRVVDLPVVALGAEEVPSLDFDFGTPDSIAPIPLALAEAPAPTNPGSGGSEGHSGNLIDFSIEANLGGGSQSSVVEQEHLVATLFQNILRNEMPNDPGDTTTPPPAITGDCDVSLDYYHEK